MFITIYLFQNLRHNAIYQSGEPPVSILARCVECNNNNTQQAVNWTI